MRALHLAIGVLVVLVHMFCYYGLESSTDRGVRGTFVLGLAETIIQCMTCARKPSYFVAFLCKILKTLSDLLLINFRILSFMQGKDSKDRTYWLTVFILLLDTSVERNTLMERVYPRLKSYCQGRGYDFQVVDMRWGVRDESTDDHMTTELCMRELRACQKLSTGPNFIVS